MRKASIAVIAVVVGLALGGCGNSSANEEAWRATAVAREAVNGWKAEREYAEGLEALLEKHHIQIPAPIKGEAN